MPIFLCNVPTSFQFFINDIFCDLLDQFVIVYLEILIFSDSIDEHKLHVKVVLLSLQKKNHLHTIRKMLVTRNQIPWFEISPRGISMDSDKVDAHLTKSLIGLETCSVGNKHRLFEQLNCFL